MKIRMLIFICGLVSFFAGCTLNELDSPMHPDSPQDPPLPRTPSILPLGRGYAWTYSYSDYDSSGTMLRSREEQNLEIGNVYGVTGNTLKLLDQYAYKDTFAYYAYEYEWENRNEGFIVAYRDLDVSTPGVYIIGEFDGGTITRYSTPQLWLAYPSTPGWSWQFIMTDSTGADTTAMTVEAIRTIFFAPETGIDNISAVNFYECVLYKQISGNSASYYYYNDRVGCVGYLNYVDGKLHRSYILTSFSQGYYWM